MDNAVEYSTMLEHAFMRSPEGIAVLSLNDGKGNWLKVNPAFAIYLALRKLSFLLGLFLQKWKIDRRLRKSFPIDW